MYIVINMVSNNVISLYGAKGGKDNTNLQL